MAQQPLSAAIARLEDQLGIRLFDRTTRHVALTAAGTAMLSRRGRRCERPSRPSRPRARGERRDRGPRDRRLVGRLVRARCVLQRARRTPSGAAAARASAVFAIDRRRRPRRAARSRHRALRRGRGRPTGAAHQGRACRARRACRPSARRRRRRGAASAGARDDRARRPAGRPRLQRGRARTLRRGRDRAADARARLPPRRLGGRDRGGRVRRADDELLRARAHPGVRVVDVGPPATFPLDLLWRPAVGDDPAPTVDVALRVAATSPSARAGSLSGSRSDRAAGRRPGPRPCSASSPAGSRRRR